MDITFQPTPHEEAIATIASKPVVTKAVFDQLLPELRNRVFTVTGIEAANVLQSLRDQIATLPAGENWEDVRGGLVDDLAPYLGEEGAQQRATLLLRTHGFQAFQAANWRLAQEDDDTTHLQYLATEDDKVRDSHLALNGVILPKNDPFWNEHYPPWEWNCRCRVRSMNPDMVAEAKDADAHRPPPKTSS
jgi:SPP1 gp7 family putative phage head morphogenesis protein